MALILGAAGLLFLSGCESTPIPINESPSSSVVVSPVHI
jgi:hypothetical protein